ncbi:hypothetical protein [Rhizobium phage RHEph12]|nr:hypothetical protein [Rhizobium phage RHEph12]
MALFAQLNVTASLPNIEYWGIAISPDAKWIACGPSGGGTQVQLLRRNPNTGHYDQIKTINGFSIGTQAIYDMAFGPNSDQLYIPLPGSGIYRALLTSPGGVDQWDLDTSTGNNPLKSHGGQIRGIGISPNGLYCGYVDSGGIINVFNVNTKATLVNNSTGAIGEDCKFSADGRWFGAVVRGGGGLSVWSTTSWTFVNPTGISASNICWAAEFSKDGNAVVGAAINGGTGSGEATYNGSAWSGGTLQSAVAMASATYLDDDLAITLPFASSAVLMYRGSSFTTETHNIPNMGVHVARGNIPNGNTKGKVLAIARVSGSGSGIVAYELVDPFTQRSVPGSVTGEYYGIAVSPDGKWIGLGPSPTNGAVKILQKNGGDADYGTVQTPSGLPTNTAGVSDMVFNASSDTLYIGMEQRVHVLKLISGTWTYDRVLPATPGSAINGIDVDAEERLLVIGTGGGLLSVIKLADDSVVFSVNNGATIQDAKFSPNGRYLGVAYQANGLVVYDRGSPLTDTFTAMTVTGGGASVANWALQFNENNDRIISGSIFSGNASSGFTLSGGAWSGQTLQSAHNIVGATYMLGTRAITISNAGAVPDIYDDPSFTAKTVPSIASVGAHAARAGRGSGYGKCVLAIARTTASGGSVVVYTLPASITTTSNGAIAYQKFAAAAQGNINSRGTGDWSYSKLTMSGQANIPIGSETALSYPAFKVNVAGGAFEPEYPDAQPWYWKGVVGVENQKIAYSTQVPTTPWLYSDIVFSRFAMDNLVHVNVEATSDLVFPKFEVTAVSGKIEGDSAIQYPKFGIAANIFDYDEVRADIVYPFAEVHATVKLDYYIDSGYSFPKFSAAGLVEFVLANGAYTFPKFEMEVDAASQRTTADILYAGFEIAADLNAPIGIASGYSYPKMAIAGEMHVPLGIHATPTYAKYELDVVGGATNGTHADYLLPKYNVHAQIGYTQSVDSVIVYQKFKIAAAVLPPADFEADIVFPKFGTSFVVDNYYGVALDAAIDMVFEGDAENTKRRKTINVFEH